MPIEPLTKRPGESRVYAVNFGNFPEVRENGETLTGNPTVAFSPVGLSINSVAIDDPRVTFRVSSGADLEDYQITVTTQTSGGNTLQETVTLLVRAVS